MDQNALSFYASPAPMSDGGRHAQALAGLPSEPGGLAQIIAGVLMHEDWAASYGQQLTPARREQAQTRRVEAMLEAMLSSREMLETGRPPERRFIGNCRHFSLLAAAAQRAKHIPARARCGFGMYFSPGKGVDHWVTEIWNGTRWQLCDFQIDDLQRVALKLDFDTLDQPQSRFLAAGRAWQMCRRGEADPNAFGLLDEAGYFFIAMNLMRDLAALNKQEMLPWDDWGSMPPSDAAMTPDDFVMFDRLADLTTSADTNFVALRRTYSETEGLRVPDRVFNARHQQSELV
jgi:hypothetical protein